MVSRWLAAGTCRNFICTVKLQGETDFQAIEKFLNIPDSGLTHLYHNKHELTWTLFDFHGNQNGNQ
jgi:23S rRNA (cytidine2498-2'-O)-methyltransferase